MSNQRSLTCINCAHWTFDGGWPGTEATPGDGWEARCVKTDPKGRIRWWMSGRKTSSADWQRTMRAAETCPDYERREVT